MKIDELRKVVRAEPFKPFTMHFAEGGSVAVPHPERIAYGPRGRSAVVYSRDDSMQIIDLLHVSRIGFGNGSTRKPRGKQK